MKSHVLIKVDHPDAGDWIATAFHSKGAWMQARGGSRDETVAMLRSDLAPQLAVEAAAYLRGFSRGAGLINCPEGLIDLPIDMWRCKRKDKATCPLQAQIDLEALETFYQHCLLARDEQQGILNAITAGNYQGFHHMAGRYLCPMCEKVSGETRYTNYHYPWELSCIDDFCVFDLETDWPILRKKLQGPFRTLTALANALCAQHTREVATQVEGSFRSALEILEFDVGRPA